MLRTRGVSYAIVSAIVAGCAVAPEMPPVTTRRTDFPPLNVAVEAGVGESLVRQAVVRETMGLRFVQPYEYARSDTFMPNARISVPVGAEFAPRPSASGAAKPEYCGLVNDPAYAGAQRQACIFLMTLEAATYRVRFVGEQPNYGSFITKDMVEMVPVQVRGASGFQRELLYSGVSGNQLNLLYREFKDDMIRPAFSQAVQFDLSAGRILGFRGARFEVLEATNTAIRFRMLEPFPRAAQ